MKNILLIILGITNLVYGDYYRSNIGIVIDNSTGLEWQDHYESSSAVGSWSNAINYCESLNLGGYSDWRLPNKNELISIVDYSMYDPVIDNIFQEKTSLNYWTSTTVSGDNRKYTWMLSFRDGSSFLQYKKESYSIYRVRCVRGEQ